MMTNQLLKFLGACFFILLLPLYYVQAAVIINEILPNPAGNDKGNPTGEFVEIHNNGTSPIDISNWSLKDDKDQVFSNIPSGTIITSGNYLIFHPTKSILNNGGDSVRLYNVSGNLIETITYPTSSDGKSYSRLNADWDWSQPSPGQANQNSSSNQIVNDNDTSPNNANSPNQSSGYTQNINSEPNEDQTPILISQSKTPDPMPSSPIIKPLPQEEPINEMEPTTPSPKNQIVSDLNAPSENISPEINSAASSPKPQPKNLNTQTASVKNTEQTNIISLPIAIIIALLAAILGLIIDNRFRKNK
jgi:hypothetical protein